MQWPIIINVLIIIFFMKTKILFCAAVLSLMISVLVTVKSYHQNYALLPLFASEKALASSEGGTDLICKCSKVQSDCAVNNWGAVCARGENIHCSGWDDNCN